MDESKKTVLILGAGASKALCKDFGTGYELVSHIKDRVIDGEDKYLSERLLSIDGITKQNTLEFYNCLSAYINDLGKNSSIDYFLDEVMNFPEYDSEKKIIFLTIAHVMITAHIVGWEGKLSKNDFTDDWFNVLLQYIDKHDLIFQHKRNKIRIVNFNYDRIIEWNTFLHYKNTFDNHKRKAWSLYHYIEECFVHVYGSVGKIEEIENMNDTPKYDTPKYLPFGHSNDDLIPLLDFQNAFITMFHERSVMTETEKKCEKFLNEAEKIIIIGYGFDDINNYRIGLDRIKFDLVKDKNIYIFIWEDVNIGIDGIKWRRENMKKIRMLLKKNVYFYFGNSYSDFLKQVLN